MLQLLTALWFLNFILLLIGLVKPSLLKSLKIPASRKSVLMILGIPCFILLIAVGSLAPKRVKVKGPESVIEKLKEQPANEVNSTENVTTRPKIETTESDIPVTEVSPSTPIINNTTPEKTVIASKYIPGLSPVDVYGNFEKIGFTTDKKISAEGSLFYSDYSENGIENHVTTFCETGVTNITSVRLSATRIEPQSNKVTDMKEFLKYGCSIPYDGADVEKVRGFIDNNYYKNKANIVISGVRFTIYSPTQFVRMVDIEME